MSAAPAGLVPHLLRRLRQVREGLGLEPLEDDPGTRFAEAVDSMGLVEFVALVADDCGVSPEAVERGAGRRFGTVAELAAALASAGLEVLAVPGRVPLPAAGAAPA